jgi:hypothetical protein
MHEDGRTSVINQSGQWTRVVVLTPASASQAGPDRSAGSGPAPNGSSSLSEPLRALFAARDWFPIFQHDPYLAFAELALREQAQSARSAWGLRRMEQTALVIIGQTAWPAELIQELTLAVHRYLPSISIWCAKDDRVEPIVAPPPLPERVASAPRAAPFSVPTVARAVSTDVAATSSPEGATPSRISREEIDMLLGAEGLPTHSPTTSSELRP